MAVVNLKPTSPGRRAVVKVVHPETSAQGAPRRRRCSTADPERGRNNTGHITDPAQGAAATSTTTAWSDFVRNKDGIPARSSASSTTRTAPATSRWSATPTAKRRYHRRAAWRSVPSLLSGAEAPIKAGNCAAHPQHPGRLDDPLHRDAAGQAARRSRARRARRCTLLAREGTYAQVRMRSGEVRRIPHRLPRDIGEVSNEEHNLRQYGKAGVKRWMGIRPTVRGVAMNPVDHRTAAANQRRRGPCQCPRGTR